MARSTREPGLPGSVAAGPRATTLLSGSRAPSTTASEELATEPTVIRPLSSRALDLFSADQIGNWRPPGHMVWTIRANRTYARGRINLPAEVEYVAYANNVSVGRATPLLRPVSGATARRSTLYPLDTSEAPLTGRLIHDRLADQTALLQLPDGRTVYMRYAYLVTEPLLAWTVVPAPLIARSSRDTEGLNLGRVSAESLVPVDLQLEYEGDGSCDDSKSLGFRLISELQAPRADDLFPVVQDVLLTNRLPFDIVAADDIILSFQDPMGQCGFYGPPGLSLSAAPMGGASGSGVDLAMVAAAPTRRLGPVDLLPRERTLRFLLNSCLLQKVQTFYDLDLSEMTVRFEVQRSRVPARLRRRFRVVEGELLPGEVRRLDPETGAPTAGFTVQRLMPQGSDFEADFGATTAVRLTEASFDDQGFAVTVASTQDAQVTVRLHITLWPDEARTDTVTLGPKQTQSFKGQRRPSKAATEERRSPEPRAEPVGPGAGGFTGYPAGIYVPSSRSAPGPPISVGVAPM